MKRRDVLETATGLTLIGSITGCLGIGSGNDIQDSDGDGVINSEDYAPNDPEVQEKSDLQNGDSEDSSSSDGRSSSDDGRSSNESNEELIGIVVGKYRSGYEGIEAGKDLIGQALDSYENEQYGLAQMAMEGFESDMGNTADAFDEAATAAGNMGETSVQQSANAGRDEASQLGDVGQAVLESAEAAEQKNWDMADSKLSEAQSSLKDAQNKHDQVMKPSKVEEEVGYSGP